MIKWRWLHEHQHDRTHVAAMLQRAALPGIMAMLYMSITMPMDMPQYSCANLWGLELMLNFWRRIGQTDPEVLCLLALFVFTRGGRDATA